jgi:hypothetical protein
MGAKMDTVTITGQEAKEAMVKDWPGTDESCNEGWPGKNENRSSKDGGESTKDEGPDECQPRSDGGLSRQGGCQPGKTETYQEKMEAAIRVARK